MDDKLKSVYNSQEFNRLGHELIEMLTDYLQDTSEEKIPVMKWHEPSDQLEFWKKVYWKTLRTHWNYSKI